MPLWTEADLAQHLRADLEDVTAWRQRYSWPHIKIGRQVRFSEADVRAIEAQHHVASPKPLGLPGQTRLSAAQNG